jgi:membrane protease YdiL (CAAX protease family)
VGGPPPRTRPDEASPTFSPAAASVVALATVLTIFVARVVGSAFGYRRAGLATFAFYALLFGGMAGSCVLVSRMSGTGSIVRDFGWSLRSIDVAWGMVTLAASVVARVIFAMIVGTDSGSSRDLRDGLLRHHDVLAVFLVAALVGAPLFEELVFRGVIQRGLTKLVGREAAIVGQGVLFGFYHVVGAFDLVSVYYVGSLSIIGIVFGIAADRTGRLGPGMIAHFLTNALAMLVLLA